MSEEQKQRAARAAVGHVEEGMRLGLGTGSTAAHFVRCLAERVHEGLSVVGVPTSEQTRRLAEELGIALTTLDETPRLDLTVDGADELDAELRLIKGGGGALLREKIVAASSDRMIVIADASKRVRTLGAFPLPVEVVGFGWRSTAERLRSALERHGMNGVPKLRCRADGMPFVTDEGHHILDMSIGEIASPEHLADILADVPGVVEHGLFIGLAHSAILGDQEGVLVLDAPAGRRNARAPRAL